MKPESQTLIDSIPEIPGYRLLNKLGEGGMGVVYRAVQLSLDRHVAIKFLHQLPDESGTDSRFRRESRLMAKMTHTNVVGVYDCGRVMGVDYIVMEFIDGPSLRSRMEPGRPWPAEEAFAMVRQIASALEWMHGQGVYHLDLKPENVLLTSSGQAKITDFGLAVPEVDARKLSDLGLVQGTIDYCSPEQRHGLPVDQRSDVFSLATLTYELLTGHLPGRVYVPVSKRNPSLPRAIDSVLERGLARDPDERYASVAEFRRDLAAALGLLNAVPRSLKWLATAAGLTAVVIALVVLGSFLSPAPPPPAEQPDDSDAIYAWALYDDPLTKEILIGSEDSGLRPDSQFRLREGQVYGPAPSVGAEEMFLPRWPSPRPVLVLYIDQRWIFCHPIRDRYLTRDALSEFPLFTNMPLLPEENNLIRNGSFRGDCLDSAEGPWHPGGPGDRAFLHLDADPDKPADQVLVVERNESESVAEEVTCYSRLRSVPDHAGTIAIVRFRTRLAEGKPLISVGLSLPLLIPKDDETADAVCLRRRSVKHPHLQPSDDRAEAWEYRIEDWIEPPDYWQTNYIVFEWPRFCTTPKHCNLWIRFLGQGRVYVDDVELFAWSRTGNSAPLYTPAKAQENPPSGEKGSGKKGADAEARLRISFPPCFWTGCPPEEWPWPCWSDKP